MKQIATKTMRADYSYDLADQLLNLNNHVVDDGNGGGGGKKEIEQLGMKYEVGSPRMSIVERSSSIAKDDRQPTIDRRNVVPGTWKRLKFIKIRVKCPRNDGNGDS